MRYFKFGMLTIFGFLLISNISYILYMVTGNNIFDILSSAYFLEITINGSTHFFGLISYLSLFPVAYFGFHLIQSVNNRLVVQMNLTGAMLIIISIINLIFGLLSMILFLLRSDFIVTRLEIYRSTITIINLLLIAITLYSIYTVHPVEDPNLNHYRTRLFVLIILLAIYRDGVSRLLYVNDFAILNFLTDATSLSVIEGFNLINAIYTLFEILYVAVFVLLTTGIFDKSTTTTNYKETAFPIPDDVQS